MEIKYGRKLLQYCNFKIQIQDSNWDTYNGESLTSHNVCEIEKARIFFLLN